MPKSRVRKKTRNKSVPLSKESRNKIRRYSFLVTITSKTGTTASFRPPAVTIGKYAAAQAASSDIHDQLAKLPQFEGANIVVEPEGHETVSQPMFDQFIGLQDQTKLLTLSLKAAVTEVVELKAYRNGTAPVVGEELEKEVTETLGKFVLTTQRQLREEQLRAQGIDPDTIVEDPTKIPNDYVAAAEPFPDGEFGAEAS